MFVCACSEVWDKAERTIRAELEAQKADPAIERWIASAALINHLRNGLSECPFETSV